MIFVLTLQLKKKKELMLFPIKRKLSLNLKATITEDLEGQQKTILNAGNSLFRINFNYTNVLQTPFLPTMLACEGHIFSYHVLQKERQFRV